MEQKIVEFERLLNRERLSEITVKYYITILRNFFSRYKTIDLENIFVYIERGTKEQNKRYSNATINTLYAIFRKFLVFLKREEEAKKIKNVRLNKTIPIVLTQEQVKVLFKAKTQEDSTLNQRNLLLLEYLYSTGCRVSEAAKVNHSDINLKEGIIIVRKGKGGKDRIVKISQKWLQKYFSFFGKSSEKNAPLFLSRNGNRLSKRRMQDIVRDASLQTNILIRKDNKDKPISPHRLRATNITHSYESGEDILAIQESAGHEHLDTTKRYIRIDKERIKKMRNPLDLL